MARGTLRGARDADGPEEKAAIERARRFSGKRSAATILWSLRNSARRSVLLELEDKPMVKVQGRSLIVERLVQDRLLDELLAGRRG